MLIVNNLICVILYFAEQIFYHYKWKRNYLKLLSPNLFCDLSHFLQRMKYCALVAHFHEGALTELKMKLEIVLLIEHRNLLQSLIQFYVFHVLKLIQ